MEAPDDDVMLSVSHKARGANRSRRNESLPKPPSVTFAKRFEGTRPRPQSRIGFRMFVKIYY